MGWVETPITGEGRRLFQEMRDLVKYCGRELLIGTKLARRLELGAWGDSGILEVVKSRVGVLVWSGVAIVTKGIALCVIVFFVGVFVFLPLTFEIRHKWAGARALAAATNEAERQKAVGSLGFHHRFPNGDWLAIFYADNHAGFVGSVAVATTSDGKWYQSKEHFCRLFQGLQARLEREQEQLALAKEIGDTEYDPANYRPGAWAHLYEGMHAPAMTAAEESLLKMGFEEWER